MKKRQAIINTFQFENDYWCASIEPNLECDYFYTPNFNSRSTARRSALKICEKLKLEIVRKFKEPSSD